MADGTHVALCAPAADARVPPCAAAAVRGCVGWQRDEEAGGGGAADDDEDDEFTVFAGFDRDNKPTSKKSAAQSHKSRGEGLSWDAERKVWNSQSKSTFAPFGSRSSFGGSWDLRSSGFRSPASLMRIRSQAEKVFNDSISSSLFTSPSMQRYKRQADTMFADVTNTLSNLAVVSEVRSFFSSWFR